MGQVIGRGDDCVVQSSAAACLHVLQRSLELFDISGELLIEVILVVKIHHKNLIVGIAGSDQIQSRLVDGVALLSHRSGVIDHNTNRNREIFLMEVSDFLRLVVLKYREVSLVEIIDQVIPVIDDRGVQRHFTRLSAEYKTTVLAADRCLTLISRPGWRVALRAMLLWGVALGHGRRSLRVLCWRGRWAVIRRSS